MLKVISLDDVIEGEKFFKEIERAFTEQGFKLIERHAWLHRDDFPQIVDLVVDEEGIEICLQDLNHEDESKRQPCTRCFIPESDKGIIRAGLTWLYGFGMVQHEYKRLDLFNTEYDPELGTFRKFTKEEIDEYYDLAAEIWERNIHLDWMRKRFPTHNGSKDPKFIYLIVAKEIFEALKYHYEKTDAGIADTRHHIFRDPNKIEALMLTQGRNKKDHDLFIESIYDQTTATTRRWLRDKRPFEIRLFGNMIKGYFIKRAERGKSEQRWLPPINREPTAYEREIWNIWCGAHIEFRNYWIQKFGPFEKGWQEPHPDKE